MMLFAKFISIQQISKEVINKEVNELNPANHGKRENNTML